MENENPSMDSTSSGQAGPTAPQNNNTLMGVLCYIGILVLIPYFVAKDNAFVKFHIKQGLVLVVIEILGWIVGMSVPFFWMIVNIINLGVFVLSIIGIVNVVQKQEKKLPLVGQFAEYFKF